MDPASPIAQLRHPGLGWPAAGRVRRPGAAPLEEVPDPAPGRGDPRHRLRCARLARPGGREGDPGRSGTTIGYDDPVTDPEAFGDLAGAARRGHRSAVRPRHLHRRTRAPGLPRRRHPGLAGRPLRWARSSSRTWSRPWPRSRSWSARSTTASRTGGAIDVLSLSIGYYHETPEDELFDPTHVRDPRGTREARHPGGVLGGQRRDQPPELPGGLRPVGATAWARSRARRTACRSSSCRCAEPQRPTDALFSNAGPWVRAYVPGAAVVSTMPTFQGGLQSAARTQGLRPGARDDRSRRLPGRLRRLERNVVRRPVAGRSDRPPPLVAAVGGRLDRVGDGSRQGSGGRSDRDHARLSACSPPPNSIERAVSEINSGRFGTARGLVGTALWTGRPATSWSARSRPASPTWKRRPGTGPRPCACARTHWRGRG